MGDLDRLSDEEVREVRATMRRSKRNAWIALIVAIVAFASVVGVSTYVLVKKARARAPGECVESAKVIGKRNPHRVCPTGTILKTEPLGRNEVLVTCRCPEER